MLANLPFAPVGGVLAVFATGGGLSIGALVGFVTLFGISLRNSIMLLSYYEQGERHDSGRHRWHRRSHRINRQVFSGAIGD